MKMGAEPKKMATFIGLIAVAGIVYWMNSSSDAPPSVASRTPVDPTAIVTGPSGGSPKVMQRRMASGHAEGGLGGTQFKLPTSIDPAKVDPTLLLDRLAKVQAVPEEGGVRNIFITQAAPPEPVKVAITKVPDVDKLHPNGPTPPNKASEPLIPIQPAKAVPPPPTPINLKYFGYSTQRSDGERKAFFLDGDDIIVAAEGEIIKKQYKVVRIKDNAVQMEDTASKSTQTLPLQPEPASA